MLPRRQLLERSKARNRKPMTLKDIKGDSHDVIEQHEFKLNE
tara:strand:+ start:140 stop:265 length:126 start_codon:yes stop_codon:yes gene_type:complete